MKTPEGYEKDDICKYLDVLDRSWYFRTFTGGFGKSGVPDIIGCIPRVIMPRHIGQSWGCFFSIEIKREGKQPTPLCGWCHRYDCENNNNPDKP